MDSAESKPDPVITKMRHSAPWSPIGLLSTIAVVFALGNVAIAPMMGEISPRSWAAVFIHIAIGAIMAQCGLVTLLGAFAMFPVFERQTFGFLATVFFFGFWTVGCATASYYGTLLDEVMWKTGMCIPLIYLSIQAPMWMMRIVFRWRIRTVAELDESQTQFDVDGPMTISQMMVSTALVAVSFALVRIAADEDSAGFWFIILVMAASTAGISFVAVIPALLLLRVQSLLNGIHVLSLYYSTAIATTLLILCIAMQPHGLDVWGVFGASLILATFGTCIVVPILIVRRAGYRLCWGRELVHYEGRKFPEVRIPTKART